MSSDRTRATVLAATPWLKLAPCGEWYEDKTMWQWLCRDVLSEWWEIPKDAEVRMLLYKDMYCEMHDDGYPVTKLAYGAIWLRDSWFDDHRVDLTSNLAHLITVPTAKEYQEAYAPILVLELRDGST